MRAIVCADGDRPAREALDAAWPGWTHGIVLVVAADGGARLAAQLGLTIDAWVGDGDSLSADELDALDRAGVPIRRASTDKDESDAELALACAIELGADDVTILGALGGRRLDHALANLGLLAHPGLGGRPARLLDATTRVSLIDAGEREAEATRLPDPRASAPPERPITVRRELTGRIGDLVSLLPWGTTVTGITTAGLRYPLVDEPLHVGPARGLSNVRERETASVEVRTGRLLIVESAATLAP